MIFKKNYSTKCVLQYFMKIKKIVDTSLIAANRSSYTSLLAKDCRHNILWPYPSRDINAGGVGACALSPLSVEKSKGKLKNLQFIMFFL